MAMNINELVTTRDLVQQEYNNLIDYKWLAARCEYLRGKFDLATELINKEQQNAADQADQKPVKRAVSNNNKGK